MILTSLSHCTISGLRKPGDSKMTKDFSCQVTVLSFLRAHETDHCSAHFKECNAWLCFALSHCTYEHVVCLELRYGVSCFVHHDSSVRRPSSATRNTEWAPISGAAFSRQPLEVSRNRKARGVFVSPEIASCPAWSASAIAHLSSSEAS